jgi:hypothetical protein
VPPHIFTLWSFESISSGLLGTIHQDRSDAVFILSFTVLLKLAGLIQESKIDMLAHQNVLIISTKEYLNVDYFNLVGGGGGL